jgi:hypothetical protein
MPTFPYEVIFTSYRSIHFRFWELCTRPATATFEATILWGTNGFKLKIITKYGEQYAYIHKCIQARTYTIAQYDVPWKVWRHVEKIQKQDSTAHGTPRHSPFKFIQHFHWWREHDDFVRLSQQTVTFLKTGRTAPAIKINRHQWKIQTDETVLQKRESHEIRQYEERVQYFHRRIKQWNFIQSGRGLTFTRCLYWGCDPLELRVGVERLVAVSIKFSQMREHFECHEIRRATVDKRERGIIHCLSIGINCRTLCSCSRRVYL